ncbi:MAG: hypothetical protein JJT76_06180 [Clostridiaceae bacterium]|nr:hypothetical protein [Clostridiaceae bacterium]
MKRKTKNTMLTVLMLAYIIGSLAYYAYNNRYEEIAFDIDLAEDILMETWQPIWQFDQDAIIDRDQNEILPPDYVQSREDFINFANKTFSQHDAERFFDDLMEDKENGDLLVKQGVFYPTIYEEGAYIYKAYTRQNRSMQMPELIIQEMGVLEGRRNYSRRNHYKMNENGEWQFRYFNGSGLYGSAEDRRL